MAPPCTFKMPMELNATPPHSPNPYTSSKSQELETEMDESINVTLISAITASALTTCTDVQESTTANPDLQLLMELIEEGFPKKAKDMPANLYQYHHIRHHLMVSDGVVTYKGRLIIPPPLRKACLTALHAAHHGTSAMVAKAEQSIFRPGITKEKSATQGTHVDRAIVWPHPK